MPGYVIHLAEAEMIIKRLLKSEDSEMCSEEWQDRFRRGCLLPDSKDEKKEITHYWNHGDECAKVQLPDIELFIKEHWQQLTQRRKYPEVFGYFVHLCLDRLFFEKYLPEHIRFLDSRGYPVQSYRWTEKGIIQKSREGIFLSELFSSDFLYGDYTKLNSYFIDKYQINIPRNDDTYTRNYKIKDPLFGMKLNDILDRLNEYCEESRNKDYKNNISNLRVLDLKSLERFLWSVSDIVAYSPGTLSSVIHYVSPFSRAFRWGKAVAYWIKRRRPIQFLKKCGKALMDYGLYSIFVAVLYFLSGIICGRKGLELIRSGNLLKSTRIPKKIKEGELEEKIEKTYRQALSKENDWLPRWKKKWEQTAEIEIKDFGDMVVSVYQDTDNLHKKNRSKNFIFKFLYIAVMILTLGGFVVSFIFNIRDGEVLSYELAENSILLITIILALNIISKWLDIKKYQETWARHYNHLYRLRKEMMRYLYCLDEYKVTKENTQKMVNHTFAKKFFEIEDENAKKFVENMENKETKITEGLRGILKY